MYVLIFHITTYIILHKLNQQVIRSRCGHLDHRIINAVFALYR